MQSPALIVAICLAVAVAVNAQKKVVCYYASWATYRTPPAKYDLSKIDPTLCTHIIYAFIGLNDDGSVRIMDPWIDTTNKGFVNFNNLRQKSPSTKTIAAIGGWAEGSQRFSSMVNDAGKRQRFVNAIVSFLKQYHFNGLDVDWEYPGQRPGSKPSDKQNFVNLLRDLKQRFSREGLSLSAAVNPTEYSASLSYNIREISQHLDFINLMTYDFHQGGAGNVGQNAPLYGYPGDSRLNVNYPGIYEGHEIQSYVTNHYRKIFKFNGLIDRKCKNDVETLIKFWISQGAPSHKIVLGVPFYGVSFTLRDPNQHKRGSPTSGPGNAGPLTKNAGTLAYYEICQNIKSGWRVERDPQQHAPYAYGGNQIVGYDDVISLNEKVNYIKRNNLGGAMVWSMDTDDFNGVCGQKNPLLKALNNVRR